MIPKMDPQSSYSSRSSALAFTRCINGALVRSNRFELEVPSAEVAPLAVPDPVIELVVDAIVVSVVGG
jgi:hypothetical protein